MAHDRAESGQYTIVPTGSGPVVVYCDMVTDNGGWTLVTSSLGAVDDHGTGYSSDLRTLTPEGASPGVWTGMVQLISDRSDVRFSCKADVTSQDMTVDLSFYNVNWYHRITAPTDADLSHDEPFPVQLGNSLLDLTKDLGGTTVAPGYYQVSVVCRDKLSQQELATFAGWMHFTTSTSYVTGPDVFPDSTSEPSVSATTSASASASATPSATASPSATTDPTTEPPTTTPTTPAATVTTTPVSSGGTLPKTGPPAAGLFAIGVVLIIIGGSFVLGTMRFDRPRPARW